jgi:rSAM/selenodomain-associated transferase 1
MGLSNHLVIMAKLPVAGRVKTRLAAEIGATEAVRFYRGLLSDTVRRLAGDRRWHTWIALTPDGAVDRFAPPAPRSATIIPQGTGSLGERMQRLMDRLPPGPAVIIGSDIPGITRSDVAAAFRALGSADAVFGPAADGGYWLVGQRRLPRNIKLFCNVRWSSEHALADTLMNVASRRVALLRTIADLDDRADYLRWRRSQASRCTPRPG